MRLLSGFLLVLMLAGCFTAGKRGEAALAIYDLGPSAIAAEKPSALSLAIEVRAPLWFDSLGINYRLLYAEPARLREYARARWAGAPASLIQQRLTRELGLISSGQGRTACLLRIDIAEFSQVFDSPSVSRGVLTGRAQWLDRSRSQLAEREINIGIAAGESNSRAGVAALTASVEQLTALLRSWEGELLADGQLAACRR